MINTIREFISNQIINTVTEFIPKKLLTAILSDNSF